jgi:DNA processing protein
VLAAIADGSSTLRSADRCARRLGLLDLDEVTRRAAAVGARFITPGHPDWFEGLTDLRSVHSPANGGGSPIGLWVRGPSGPPGAGMAATRAVAVVGARDATSYGLGVAADLGSSLSDAGVLVVSGGALGIDAAAHRGALAAGGATVAVLACGVDIAYPRAHADLLERIAVDGWLVSELPPGTPPTRHGFLIRNRIVAALSAGTVVVEAALRSGALNTAAWAQALLRVVAAVPGPVTSPLSAGCHRLIRDAGAVLVTGADELLELVGPLNAEPPSTAQPALALDPRAGLDPVCRRVLEAVPATMSMSLGRLRAITGDATMPLLTALGELLELDLVEQTATGWRLSASQRRDRRR